MQRIRPGIRTETAEVSEAALTGFSLNLYMPMPLR